MTNHSENIKNDVFFLLDKGHEAEHLQKECLFLLHYHFTSLWRTPVNHLKNVSVYTYTPYPRNFPTVYANRYGHVKLQIDCLKQLWLQVNGHAWFHLQRLRWPVRNGEGAKNSKWKYMSPAGFEPTPCQSTTGKLQRLRLLGHEGLMVTSG